MNAPHPPPDGTAEGVVLELLPSQLVRVELEGRHQVTAHLSGDILPGATIDVEAADGELEVRWENRLDERNALARDEDIDDAELEEEALT